VVPLPFYTFGAHNRLPQTASPPHARIQRTPRVPPPRPLASRPPGLRYLNGPTERILQNQLPPRPDACSYTGSTAGLSLESEFAERGGEDLIEERRARDAERKRAAAAAG
jgi:hypothetical protein